MEGHEAALDWARWRERWPNAGSSRFVEAAGLRWHVQVAGQGPVVLLLHGTAGATHAWRDILPRLATRYTVVAPDLPGHAFTTQPALDRLTLHAMGADVAALLTTLGLRPELVAGHSAGAAILMRMALDGALPDARLLVGLNAALLAPPRLPAAFGGGLLTRLFGSAGLAQGIAGVAQHTLLTRAVLRSTGSRVDADHVALYEALVAAPGHVRTAMAMMARWDVDGLLRRMAALPLPVLLIAGDEDGWVPAGQIAQLAREHPRARVERVAGLGHLMHEEAGDEFGERLLRAFDEAERG